MSSGSDSDDGPQQQFYDSEGESVKKQISYKTWLRKTNKKITKQKVKEVLQDKSLQQKQKKVEAISKGVYKEWLKTKKVDQSKGIEEKQKLLETKVEDKKKKKLSQAAIQRWNDQKKEQKLKFMIDLEYKIDIMRIKKERLGREREEESKDALRAWYQKKKVQVARDTKFKEKIKKDEESKAQLRLQMRGSSSVSPRKVEFPERSILKNKFNSSTDTTIKLNFCRHGRAKSSMNLNTDIKHATGISKDSLNQDFDVKKVSFCIESESTDMSSKNGKARKQKRPQTSSKKSFKKTSVSADKNRNKNKQEAQDQNQIAMINQIWSLYDVDESGMLDREECKTFVRDYLQMVAVGQDEFDDDVFNQMFDDFDEDGSELIEKEEMHLFLKKITGIEKKSKSKNKKKKQNKKSKNIG